MPQTKSNKSKSNKGSNTSKKPASSPKPKNNAVKSVSSSKPKDSEVEIKVLKELYLNADTGKLSVDNVIKKIEDTNLRNILLCHYESYNELSNKIAAQLNKNGETPKESNVFGKAMLWSSINLNTLFDKTPSHIADMMIQGNNMGIISINKELNCNSDSLSEDTLNLASDLISLEQKNVEDLKTFL